MDHNNSNLKTISNLLSLATDGEINDEQFKTLKTLLKNKTAREHYYSLVNIEVLLRDSKEVYEENQESPITKGLLHELAEYEAIAPAIEIPSEKPPQKKKKLSKFNTVSLIMSTAAVLIVVLFLKFYSNPTTHVDVATLIDQINPQWAQYNDNMQIGNRLRTNEGPLELIEGVVKIHYDDGVSVLIEGPTVFSIERVGIYLEYGQLYSRVPETALGFTVTTPTSQFVDHGTEFGVQADVNGSSELHVLKGSVQLFAGSKGKARTGKMVTEGEAVRYDANREQIKTIPVEKNVFVQNVNSKTGTVWRGQKVIDLADIVSGGNGLMTTTQQQFIYPKSGIVSHEFESKDRVGDYTYHPVDMSFVDGVFIPSADEGFPKVTSAGHEFKDCPSTDNTGREMFNTSYYREDVDCYKRCGNPIFHLELKELKQHAIFMHSNVGITFDLNEIRAAHSYGSIKEFRTGILFNRSRYDRMIDFWVLIDGQVRYQKTDVRGSDTISPIQVPISKQDQFLSLVVTDGSDDVSGYGWGFFIEPVLVLGDE